jgi:hypothetical protein
LDFDGWEGIALDVVFQRFWKGLSPTDLMGIGIEPCPGFHWPWKGFLPVGIPDEGIDPYHRFQGPWEVFSPCVGIVPYTGFFDPKPGLPLVETTADENSLLPNTSNK